MQRIFKFSFVLLICLVLIFSISPLTAEAAEPGTLHSMFNTNKEGEPDILWLETDSPVISCEWSCSDPDAVKFEPDTVNAPYRDMYTLEYTYRTYVKITLLKGGSHTITATYTTAGGTFTASTSPTVHSIPVMEDLPATVTCVVGEAYQLSPNAYCAELLDSFQVSCNDEVAVSVFHTCKGALPGEDGKVRYQLCAQFEGLIAGEYTLTLELVYGDNAYTYDVQLNVIEDVFSGEMSYLSSSRIYVDGTAYGIAADGFISDTVWNLGKDDVQTVVCARNSAGEVTKVYHISEVVQPSVFLSTGSDSFTYSNSRWLKSAIEGHVTASLVRTYNCPFTAQSLKSAQLKCKIGYLKLSINTDELEFWVDLPSGGGYLTEFLTPTRFNSATLYYGNSQTASFKLHIDQKYVPKSASEAVEVTAVTTTDWSSGEYECSTGVVMLGNLDIQKQQTQEKKTEREIRKAAAALEKFNALKSRTVLTYDANMSKWFADEQYQEINDFLVLYISWLLAVEDGSFLPPSVTFRVEEIGLQVRRYLGIDEIYSFVTDSLLGLSSDKIKSEVTVKIPNKDGDLVSVKFDLVIPTMSGSGGTFASLSSIKYTISGPKPENALSRDGVRGMTYVDFDAFADVVLDYVNVAYSQAWGSSADKVASMLVSTSFDTLIGGSYADRVYTSVMADMKDSIKKYCVKCPVDVFVYDMSGNLVGSIVDNQIVSGQGVIHQTVSGDEKYIYLSNDSYALKLVGNDTGELDYAVEEYVNGILYRKVEINDVPLEKGVTYSALAPEYLELDQEVYSLETQTGTAIDPDTDTMERTSAESITAVSNGWCGPEAKWTLYSNGLLEIYGTGAMYDYDASNSSPTYASSDVKYVVIHDGITRIGEYAFCGYYHQNTTWNKNIQVIVIPDSVTEIGEYALYKCSGLGDVYIGSGVSSIGNWAFSYCESIREITVDTENQHYQSVNDVLFSKDGSALLLYPRISGATYEIPEGTTTIGKDAFGNNAILTSVTIPASVTLLDECAFDGCSGLTEVHFKGSCPQIADDAFSNVEATVYFPGDDDTWIEVNRKNYGGTLIWQTADGSEGSDIYDQGTWGDNLYWSFRTDGKVVISGAGDMHDDVNRNSQYPWEEYREKVTSVVIESGVTSIGKYAFDDYSYLQNVTLSDTVSVIGKYAFRECINLESIVIPYSVTEICDGAFKNCYALSGTTILNPDCLIDAGYSNNAFGSRGTNVLHGWNNSSTETFANYNNYSFTAHEFANGSCTICGCSQALAGDGKSGICGRYLKWTLDDDGTLTISGQGQMYSYGSVWPWKEHQSLIIKVVLEQGVTSIGSNAFARCEKLTDVVISASVDSIAVSAFTDCRVMQAYHVDANNTCYASDASGVLFNAEMTTLIDAPLGIAGEYAIPETTTEISEKAFYDRNALTAVRIPGSVVSIGSLTFGSCDNLTSITFTGNAPSMSDDVFKYVIATVVYPSGNETWTEEKRINPDRTLSWVPSDSDDTQPDADVIDSGSCGDDLRWTLTSDGVLTIFGEGEMKYCTWDEWRDSIRSVVIEEGATTIGFYAFSSTALTDITIPDSMTSIGEGAFQNSALTSIRIPANVTSIADDAFRACESFAAYEVAPDNPVFYSDFQGVLYNSDQNEIIDVPYGFEGAYTVPSTVISIPDRLFDSHYGLTEITVSEGVAGIGNYAFNNCKNLTKVTLDDGITSIGDYAFYYCTSLTDIVVPNSVTSIGKYAFRGCSNLTSVVLSDSMTEIEERVFFECYALADITIPEGITSIGECAFQNCRSLTSITLPESLSYIGRRAFDGCSKLSSVIFKGNAPFFEPDAFYGQYTTVYYPGDNPTWTAEIQQSCSGVDAWVPYTSVSAPDVNVTNILSTGKIKLSWNKVDGAVKYHVYRSTSMDGDYDYLTSVKGTSVTNTKVVPGQTYYYYVVAVSENGTESEKSSIVSRTCNLAQPKVKLSNVSASGKIKISWNKVDGAVKYKVYRSTSKNSGYTLLTTTSKTSVVNTKTEAGKTYYYYVVAVSADGIASEKSNTVARACDLAQPVVKLANVAKSGKIKISWNKVEGAVKYEVYRATSKNGKYTKLITTKSTSVTNTSATAGKTYYYKVKAICSNSAGNSAFSEVKSRMCDLARPDIEVERNKKGKPVVSWDKVSGAKSYKVYIYDANGKQIKTVTTTSSKLTHSSAVKNKTYSYRVVAIHSNSSANSAKSLAVKIKSK